MRNKAELITKYKHVLTLKNYSSNTINAYLNGLGLFLKYVQERNLKAVTSKDLVSFFYECKAERGYSYSAMKQLLASVKFLYQDVLKKEIDFDFNIKMKKPSTVRKCSRLKKCNGFWAHSKTSNIYTCFY